VATDELAEAEANIRIAVEHDEVPGLDWSLPILLAEYDRRGDQVRVQEIAFQGQAATESYLRADLAAAQARIAALEAVVDAARALIRDDGANTGEVSAASVGRGLALYAERRATLVAALDALDGESG
jgi:hypothetical protein